MMNRLLSQLPIGIQIFNREGLCTEANPALLKLFQVQAEDIINKYNIFHDPLAREVGTAAAFERALKGEAIHLKNLHFDFQYARPEYSRALGHKIIQVSILPIMDEQGQVSQVVGLNVDVSERYTAEQEHLAYAIQSERVRVLEQLISDISHDLRTPLSVINTSLYLLQKAPKSDQEKYTAMIEVQISRLKRLIDGLIHISRLNALETIRAHQVDLKSLLEQNCRAKQQEYPDLLFHLEILSPSQEINDYHVQGHEEDLNDLFRLLLDNAAQHSPPGGQIRISLDRTSQHVLIELSDQGGGIPEADLPHIFEAFYRVDKARSNTHGGGAGLGLAIAQRIVELHQGSITVESLLDQGSRFRVILPQKRYQP